MKLAILPEPLAVCRLSAAQSVPQWAQKQHSLLSITYAEDELSIVCAAAAVPPGVQSEHGWRAIKVQGPLDFSLVGILASLTTPLAEHAIPIFALSTYDTDYLLIKAENLQRACDVLQQQGHQIFF